MWSLSTPFGRVSVRTKQPYGRSTSCACAVSTAVRELACPASVFRPLNSPHDTPVKAGAGPYLTPRVARDQILEVLGERGGALDRAVDVLVAHHRAAQLHPLLVAIVAHEVRRCSSTSECVGACRGLRGGSVATPAQVMVQVF